MNHCESCGAYVTPGASDCAKCGRVFGAVESSPTETAIFAGLGYFARLVGWLVVGGFLTLGPGLLHGIERTVGSFVLAGTFIAWVTLPFTGLVALTMPSVASRRVLNINRLIWYVFLIALYFRLI